MFCRLRQVQSDCEGTDLRKRNIKKTWLAGKQKLVRDQSDFLVRLMREVKTSRGLSAAHCDKRSGAQDCNPCCLVQNMPGISWEQQWFAEYSWQTRQNILAANKIANPIRLFGDTVEIFGTFAMASTRAFSNLSVLNWWTTLNFEVWHFSHTQKTTNISRYFAGFVPTVCALFLEPITESIRTQNPWEVVRSQSAV